jgi:cell division protein FtsN
MTDIDRDNARELGLQDEDRLPWLEAVESDEEEGLSAQKLMGFLIAALIALGLVVGGIWWLRSQHGPSGDNSLIAAQEGDYKVKPDEPGGMKVEGQGDSAFATSEGAEANAKVNMGAQPEAPVAATKAVPPVPPKPVASGSKAVTTDVPAASKMPAAPPAAVAATPAAGGALVQLGAYGSQVSADQAWASISGKVAGLSGASKSILPAAVGGNTVYRLRANAGSPSAAAALCSKVKAAGSPCIVVK